jgi:ABC-type transporter MlaC component
MKRYFVIVLVAALSITAQAQTKDDGQELIDNFFDYYKNKGYANALKYALSTNKWIKPEGNEMDNIIISLSKQVDVMGELIGFEELKTKALGSRFRIASYLVYYQRDPIRFTFELYKNNLGWEISSVEFDTAFDEELEESMKLTAHNQGFR